MANVVIHENGISMRLCEICERYNDFRTDFLGQFDNFPKQKEIEYMWFTGYYETQFGKPDITIRFTDGDFFFIEVKTKYYTEVQPNQELGEIDPNNKKKTGYVGLIENLGQNVENSYAFLVDPYHPGFEEKTKNVGNYKVDVVKWNEVVGLLTNIVNDLENNNKSETEDYFRIKSFLEEIKNNIDGIKDSSNNTETFSVDEISFFKYPSLFCTYGAFLEKIKKLYEIGPIYVSLKSIEDHKTKDITIKLFIDKKKYKNKHKIQNYLPNWGYYLKLEKYYTKGKPNNTHSDSVFIGYSSTVMAQYKDKSAYALSIAIYYNFIDSNKLKKRNEKYFKDNDGWYYFPINDLLDMEKTVSIDDIKEKIIYIFSNFLPNDTRRINYGGKND